MYEKMTFGDFTFTTNPSSVTFSDSRNIKNVSFPYMDTRPVDFGKAPRIISCKGEFTGSDAYIQYERLRKVFSDGERGVLCIPGYSLFYAIPYKLEIRGTAQQNSISYSFSFIEVE